MYNKQQDSVIVSQDTLSVTKSDSVIKAQKDTLSSDDSSFDFGAEVKALNEKESFMTNIPEEKDERVVKRRVNTKPKAAKLEATDTCYVLSYENAFPKVYALSENASEIYQVSSFIDSKDRENAIKQENRGTEKINNCDSNITDNTTYLFYNNSFLKYSSKKIQPSASNSKVNLKSKLKTMQTQYLQHEKEVAAQKVNQDWIVIVLIFAVLILGWTKMFYSKYLGQTFQAMINNQSSTKLYEERNILTQRVAVSLNLLYIINLSLFFYYFSMSNMILPLGKVGWSLFISFVGVFVLVYLAKAILYLFLGFVFNNIKDILLYIHNVFIYSRVTGVLLLPLVIMAPYLPFGVSTFLQYIMLFIIIFIFVLRLVRAFQLGSKIKFSIFYMILYLCTLEIIPVLFGIKIYLDLAGV